MQRVTVTLDDDLIAEIDRIVEARGYQSRSEALRDVARAGLLEFEPNADGRKHWIVPRVVV